MILTGRIQTGLAIVASLVLCGACAGARAAADPHRAAAGDHRFRGYDRPGFLIVAPDRGFLGNEEIREIYETVRGSNNATLVFTTDERTGAALEEAANALVQRGADGIIVAPLFLSPHDLKFQYVKSFAERADRQRNYPPIEFARTFGESYLAVEVLADRLRGIESPTGKRLLVVGYGTGNDESRQRMEEQWLKTAENAAAGFGFKSVASFVWLDSSASEGPSRDAEAVLAAALKGPDPTVVVPFHLARKLDSMMSFNAYLQSRLPRTARFFDADVLPHPAVANWLQREMNRYLPLEPEDVGVVFLAHGSDYHWNETMRRAAAPLTERYKIEFAFCMADQPLVERAVRRLEQRGARAIVIVRVFGFASSFQESVERMIGLDIEGGKTLAQGHAHHGHDHGVKSGPQPRIRSGALITTVGGLEAHPLFARALLERAVEHSLDPTRETVILVAHGTGSDAHNAHWLANLEALAAHMRANGGSRFQAIEVATWREDWPGKREPWIENVRKMVAQAMKGGGRAIVVPARTTGQGPEREFLEGLEYSLASGFAPHPLFVRWVEEQIHEGIAKLDSPVGGHRVSHAATAF